MCASIASEAQLQVQCGGLLLENILIPHFWHYACQLGVEALSVHCIAQMFRKMSLPPLMGHWMYKPGDHTLVRGKDFHISQTCFHNSGCGAHQNDRKLLQLVGNNHEGGKVCKPGHKRREPGNTNGICGACMTCLLSFAIHSCSVSHTSPSKVHQKCNLHRELSSHLPVKVLNTLNQIKQRKQKNVNVDPYAAHEGQHRKLTIAFYVCVACEVTRSLLFLPQTYRVSVHMAIVFPVHIST